MIKTTLKIDGMMCGMCESHINDVIRRELPHATKVSSSHTKGISTFVTEDAIDPTLITAAIAETGYQVIDVQTEEYKKKFLGLF